MRTPDLSMSGGLFGATSKPFTTAESGPLAITQVGGSMLVPSDTVGQGKIHHPLLPVFPGTSTTQQ